MVNRFLLLAGAALAGPAVAQVSNTVGTVPIPPSQPAPTPTPSPPPATPLPTPTVAPVVPPPVVTTATPTPEVSTPAAVRRRAATSTAAPVARPAPTPAPTPTPTPSAAPAVLPSALPSAAPSVAAPAEPEVDGGLPFWAVPAGLVALLLAGAALVAWRRRSRAETDAADEMSDVPAPPAATPAGLPLARDAATAPMAPRAAAPLPQFLEPAVPLAPRAALAVTVTPRRAGVNLLTATAEIEVTITNEGDVPANDVRVSAQLTSAQPGQDDALGRFFAEAVTRPVTAPFALAPGEERTVRALVTLPRDAIVVLTAGDRPMFVPVVAINVVYAHGNGQTGQTAAAFAIGIERDGATKLAPFWMDGPSRMHDRLGVRPHALAVRR